MKFKNLNKKKLLIVLMSSFIITSLSGCKNNSNTTYNTIESSSSNETNIENSNLITNQSTTFENKTTNKNEYSENDILVINEFENLEKQTDDLMKSGDNILDNAKSIFITTVDFIFYNSEINGIKFNDLTDSGKQKILEISTNIDTKIENKFPNYKENISQKATYAFNKASVIIKKGANNLNDFTKEKLTQQDYNSLIEAKEDFIKYSKNAVDVIENVSFKLYDSGKQKVKNWYEELKNN